MGELRAWKSRLTFKIRFQAVFWHELCFSAFSHSLFSRSFSAGLPSDGPATKLLSARDWFWSFFLKDAAQTDFSCVFVLLSGSVTWSSVSFVLHFNNGENAAFPSVWYYCAVGLSITPPLLELFLGLDRCPAVHPWKQKKPKIILTLNCENPGAIASYDTILANFRQCHCTVCFYSKVAIYVFLIYRLTAITW